MITSLVTFKQFCERQTAFTERQLRWIIFRADDETSPDYHRFKPAISRIGRRIYIDEPPFMAIAKGEV